MQNLFELIQSLTDCISGSFERISSVLIANYKHFPAGWHRILEVLINLVINGICYHVIINPPSKNYGGLEVLELDRLDENEVVSDVICGQAN
jgi:hypothetical protein